MPGTPENPYTPEIGNDHSRWPFIAKLWRDLEVTLAIASGLSLLVSLHSARWYEAQVGGITPGLWLDSVDTNYLLIAAGFAVGYAAVRMARITANIK